MCVFVRLIFSCFVVSLLNSQEQPPEIFTHSHSHVSRAAQNLHSQHCIVSSFQFHLIKHIVALR